MTTERERFVGYKQVRMYVRSPTFEASMPFPLQVRLVSKLQIK